MRRGEAGFTLLELVVTVAITVILLAAGGYMMLSMHPGALRAALDDSMRISQVRKRSPQRAVTAQR